MLQLLLCQGIHCHCMVPAVLDAGCAAVLSAFQPAIEAVLQLLFDAGRQAGRKCRPNSHCRCIGGLVGWWEVPMHGRVMSRVRLCRV